MESLIMLRLRRCMKDRLAGNHPSSTGEEVERWDSQERTSQFLQQLSQHSRDWVLDRLIRIALIETLIRKIKAGREERDVLKAVLNAGYYDETKQAMRNLGIFLPMER